MNKNHCKLFILLLFSFGSTIVNGQLPPPVELSWLDTTALSQPIGTTWGVPWKRGAVKVTNSYSLINPEGKAIGVQTWPLAYWPDGSVKWTALAAVPGLQQGKYKLQVSSTPPNKIPGSFAQENGSFIRINTGNLQCVIAKRGKYLIDSLVMSGVAVGTNGRLECILQKGPEGEDFESPRKEKYTSNIQSVSLEQSGPVRSVVRVQGNLQSTGGQHSWLPFSIRLYFYNGSNAVRMVNTITYDGDDQRDFIKGLGLVFNVPMREQLHNRHVRFAGDGPGIWAEPVKLLVGRAQFMLNGTNVFPGQQAGKPVANEDQFDARTQALLKHLPIWNDYKLVQSNADGYNIQKRTNPQSTWLDAIAGKRSAGLVFVGDTRGGLAVGLKDFWQSYPAALEVRNAARDIAELRVWLWSPYAEAMDMRHYDTIGHDLTATYEDWQPGYSTPYGIARTSELMLFAHDHVPANAELSSNAAVASRPPVLVNTPQYLHSAGVFGEWTVPDRSTAGKRWLEGQLDKAIDFYKTEIDQRNWYGFWNYGDVMHAYDPVRHTWRYDIGGFAWDNTELSTDMWLWYSFLRTGRSDVFRMAEAMTRHTSEVDVYHLGKFAGLGSRHNVRHWGDGSKEVRESQAAYRRFYYYLTADERTGDMMREVAATADIAMAKTDPLRMILSPTKYPTHARMGPDWLALVGNWMTEWERTGDKRWRDKIMAGVNSFAKMPYGLFSGQQAAFGYDPATNKMHQLNDTLGAVHLSILMGGPEIVNELEGLLQDKNFSRMWLQFCRLYGAPQPEIIKVFGKGGNLSNLAPDYARMPAFVAKATGDTGYASKAWNLFLAPGSGTKFDWKQLSGPDVLKPLKEVPSISTNSTAQWSLNAIQLLSMIGDKLPAQHPLWSGRDSTNASASNGSQ
ncbi:Tat pathway signal sequence domain protein [Segetibacter sp. 3557_3]|uniref:exo-rhamnogalacturonan lyase family protein n=1 Tax=Segetibacter sp. 3557_3 TaxID=2547429 RepID=UPI00105877CD|nr:Tat pathway signal sequence domain protein [Segetibacter sp. 3557_3]TDH24215.1 Tat pathway signal sequence domain protein [Segetibacter sp. 3557_3]